MSEAGQRGYVRGELTVHHDPAGLTKVTKALRGVGRTVALVPTMGALHTGHLELVRQAKLTGAVVVVSIFVNPLQFGQGEDLDAYPRTLDSDLELLREAGVELAFVPSVSEMYPHGRRTTIHPGPLGSELEGASRPGHFAGMLTVVAKLFNIVGPNAAYFGEKDYQQLTLIRQMVADLDLDIRIVGVPTVREQDGLALSSRNRYLDAEEREIATTLSAALVAGAHAASGGVEAILSTAREVLAQSPRIEVDYLEVRGADLGPAPERGDGRLLVAARLGTTRLIDNVGVAVGTGFLERATGPVDPRAEDNLQTR
ncbi:pantoate--beta-alanine ligase [Rhodococcus sp. NPDC047139]|uniref:pantoate--beta-alanine ligase n=1 Tax=Rhodococcus sp. NPDC047139 TaxID=3155141 RepID=UPI003409E209